MRRARKKFCVDALAVWSSENNGRMWKVKALIIVGAHRVLFHKHQNKSKKVFDAHPKLQACSLVPYVSRHI